MKELVDIIDTIGGRVSMGVGTLAGIVFAIFKINTNIDRRIDTRSVKAVDKAVAVQHEKCNLKYTEDNAKIQKDIEWIRESLKRIERKKP